MSEYDPKNTDDVVDSPDGVSEEQDDENDSEYNSEPESESEGDDGEDEEGNDDEDEEDNEGDEDEDDLIVDEDVLDDIDGITAVFTAGDDANAVEETATKERVGKQRKSLPILYNFEKAGIFSIRKAQLERGAQPTIELDKLTCEITIDAIVNEEFRQSKIPIKVKRNFPDGFYEYWNIKELK